jgi:hypothetical protein
LASTAERDGTKSAYTVGVKMTLAIDGRITIDDVLGAPEPQSDSGRPEEIRHDLHPLPPAVQRRGPSNARRVNSCYTEGMSTKHSINLHREAARAVLTLRNCASQPGFLPVEAIASVLHVSQLMALRTMQNVIEGRRWAEIEAVA